MIKFSRYRKCTYYRVGLVITLCWTCFYLAWVSITHLIEQDYSLFLIDLQVFEMHAMLYVCEKTVRYFEEEMSTWGIWLWCHICFPKAYNITTFIHYTRSSCQKYSVLLFITLGNQSHLWHILNLQQQCWAMQTKTGRDYSFRNPLPY